MRRTTLMGGIGMCVEMVGGFDWQGVSPGGRAFFLLLRQKKEAKEKATPRSAPGVARSLALLGRPGGLPELACGSDMANRNPPARLRCSAPSTGARKRPRSTISPQIVSFHGQPPKQPQNKAATTSSTPARKAEPPAKTRYKNSTCPPNQLCNGGFEMRSFRSSSPFRSAP